VADEEKRILLSVRYESPWERLFTWLWAIDADTDEPRFEVAPGTLRDRLACFCDERDSAWRERYVRSGRTPRARWRRRTVTAAGGRLP
jgi:hypothetical protein